MLMSASDRPATLFYQPNGFRVINPGSHVVCAVSGEAIVLEALRYWSVERQEAYASPALATQALLDAR
ncbi:hypothetical protein B0I00_2582 [Novosphingobium kunmingense]|uniref:DUF2093 domain-containing protein n=1 Tax=Novosphingobium kunmingense TaxID=1211806 RepID=A0A2N0H4U1_9SPHN|nr:DUF2093 domain-containing protein [Novosphingobium kunmingense]PKB13954.1 hypothetical protein B0I00_2582 [Novosphingobium kunmingense]